MVWPFKWKLSACTFTWCHLFLKILKNKIWKFGRNLPLATFGSERLKPMKRLVFIIFHRVLWKTLTFTKFIVHNSHITVSWRSKIQPSWVHNWKHKCWAPISNMYTCQVIFIMYSRNVIRDLKKRKRWCTGFCPLTLIHDKSRLRD